MTLRWLLLRAGGIALILWASVWSRHLEMQRELPFRLRATEFVEGMVKMAARWKGEDEPELRLLGGLPNRATWEWCKDPATGLPSNKELCADARAAALFFPPSSREIGRKMAATWKGDEFPVPNISYVVSWYAGRDPMEMYPSELLLLATCTAPLLGAPVEGNSTPIEALAGQERLRQGAIHACGSCAPKPALLATYTRTPFPVSIAIAGEVGARGTGTLKDPVAPLGALAIAIRRGEEVPPEALELPGQAGLVALEWGRLGDERRLPALLKMANEGPSAADRIAALYAALRISGGFEGVKKWEGLPGSEVAVPRALAVASALDL